MRCCDRFVVTFGWSQSYHLCPTPKNKQRAKSGQKQRWNRWCCGALEGMPWHLQNCKPHWRWLKFIYTTNHIITMTKQRWRRRPTTDDDDDDDNNSNNNNNNNKYRVQLVCLSPSATLSEAFSCPASLCCDDQIPWILVPSKLFVVNL